MTRDTQQFIHRLADSLTPVRPLPRPWIRAAIWCGVSVPVLGLIVLAMSRAGESLWTHVDRRLMLEQLAALATGITAAAAAFATTIPGSRRRVALLPLVPLGVWLGDLGQSCIQDAVAPGSPQVSLLEHWRCLPATLIVGAFPATAMVVMLRRGAPLAPRLTTVLGALAAAGLGNFAVGFVHALDASIVVLVWHASAVFALSALSAMAGPSLFKWSHLPGQTNALS